MTQEELLDQVVDHLCQSQIDEEKMRKLILGATNVTLSSECLTIYLLDVLYRHFHGINRQKIIIDISMQIINEQEAKLCKLKKYDDRRYYLNNLIVNLSDLILIFSLSDSLTNKELNYYFRHVKRSKNEIIYQALEIAEWYENDQAWIFIYEYGSKQKINFSQNLKDKYNDLLNNKD